MSNNLMRHNPFHDIARFEPFRGIEDFFHDFRMKSALRDFVAEPQIKIDVTETDRSYMIKAEIPGVKKEDIKIDIDRNQVSISAETKVENEEKEGESVIRSERYYGQQYRSFTLAHDIDDEKVEAKYQDGVLKLSLPKKAVTNGKKIKVN